MTMVTPRTIAAQRFEDAAISLSHYLGYVRDGERQSALEALGQSTSAIDSGLITSTGLLKPGLQSTLLGIKAGLGNAPVDDASRAADLAHSSITGLTQAAHQLRSAQADAEAAVRGYRNLAIGLGAGLGGIALLFALSNQ